MGARMGRESIGYFCVKKVGGGGRGGFWATQVGRNQAEVETDLDAEFGPVRPHLERCGLTSVRVQPTLAQVVARVQIILPNEGTAGQVPPRSLTSEVSRPKLANLGANPGVNPGANQGAEPTREPMQGANLAATRWWTRKGEHNSGRHLHRLV